MKMSELDGKIFVYNRLNSIYKDLSYALESNSDDQSWNIQTENDIVRLIDNMKKVFPQNERIKDLIYTRMNPDSLTRKGQTMFLLSQVRKLADVIDLKFELDKAQLPPQNVFNVVQNQNVVQNTTQIYENMLTNINQLDMDTKTKQKILELVKEFKDESSKSHPDLNRLVNILKEIGTISKVTVAMLSYWASISGILEKILHHISSLLK